jgi:hypothetical protein
MDAARRGTRPTTTNHQRRTTNYQLPTERLRLSSVSQALYIVIARVSVRCR